MGKSNETVFAALLSDGIKVCSKDFWHGYTKAEDWILADGNGIFGTTN